MLLAAPSTSRVAKKIPKAVASALAVVTTAQAPTTTARMRVRRKWSAIQPAGSSTTMPMSAAAVGMAPPSVSPKPHSSCRSGSTPGTMFSDAPSTRLTDTSTTAGHHPTASGCVASGTTRAIRGA